MHKLSENVRKHLVSSVLNRNVYTGGGCDSNMLINRLKEQKIPTCAALYYVYLVRTSSNRCLFSCEFTVFTVHYSQPVHVLCEDQWRGVKSTLCLKGSQVKQVGNHECAYSLDSGNFLHCLIKYNIFIPTQLNMSTANDSPGDIHD